MITEIQRFAEQMQIELDTNAHKGNFMEWTGIDEKLQELEWHKAKLIIALKMGHKQAVKELLADCANIFLSIGIEGNLYKEETIDTGFATIVKWEIITIPKIENGTDTEHDNV